MEEEIQLGPFPPDGFIVGGKAGHVKSSTVWKLINFLWSRPGGQASVDSLAEPVWGDATHQISYLALATLRREANRFFREHGMPFMVRIKQETVRLIDQRKR